MAPRPHKVCLRPGCSRLTQSRNGYCIKCQEYAEQRAKERFEKARQASEARRGNSHQRGYGAKWRKAREVFLREHPLCEYCLEHGRHVPATVVDHFEPHRGDMKLFWRRSNWRASCKTCHDRKTRSGR